jgi:hypothetical protein
MPSSRPIFNKGGVSNAYFTLPTSTHHRTAEARRRESSKARIGEIVVIVTRWLFIICEAQLATVYGKWVRGELTYINLEGHEEEKKKRTRNPAEIS